MKQIHRIYLWSFLLIAVFTIPLLWYAGVARSGNDYGCLWMAGRMALDGRIGTLYDYPVFLAAVKDLFPDYPGACGYFYPPHALLFQAPFSLFGPVLSQYLWLTASAALLAGVAALLCRPRLAALAVLLHPAIVMNLNFGQNGLFSAALIGLALGFERRRPVVAGAALAVLSYKPHLAAAVGLAFLVSGHWRVLASAALTTLLLAAASLAVFGRSPWEGFLGINLIQSNLLNEQMNAYMMQGSIFRSLRMAGLPDAWCTALQGLGVVVGAAAMWHAGFRRDDHLRLAQISAALLLVLPRFGTYDLAFLAIPAVLLSGPGRLSAPLPAATTLLFWLLPALGLLPATLGWYVGPVLGLLLLAGCVLQPGAPRLIPCRTPA